MRFWWYGHRRAGVGASGATVNKHMMSVSPLYAFPSGAKLTISNGSAFFNSRRARAAHESFRKVRREPGQSSQDIGVLWPGPESGSWPYHASES